MILTSGQQAFGVSSFGSSYPGNYGTVTVAPVVIGVGPSFSVGYTWNGYISPSESLTMQSVRVAIYSSDYAKQYFDTGWFATTLASGASGTYLINAVSAGVPTDTGAGSANPALHLAAVVYGSPTVNPLSTGFFSSGASTAFDIAWGVPSLVWNPQPEGLVPGTALTVNWLFSSTRNFVEGFWEVVLSTPDGSNVYADSTLTAGTAVTYAIAYALQPNTSYLVTVQAQNTNGVPAKSITALFVAGTVAMTTQTAMGGPLQRFVEMIAFQININRSLVEQVRNASNPRLCPGNLLPLLAQQLGVSYEAEMGMAQTRRLLATVVHEYKNKGTATGIAGISTAVTGWAATVNSSANQMLASSQIATSPHPVLGTVVVTSSPSTGNPVSPTGYIGNAQPAVWPPGLTKPPAVAWFNSGGGTDTIAMDFSSLLGLTPDQWGIPVSAGTANLSAGVWVWVGGLASNPSGVFSLSFWGPGGNLISQASAPAQTLSMGAWTLVQISGIVPPAGTTWMSYDLVFNTISFVSPNGIIVLSAPQVVFANALPAYAAPRQINITLSPDRINLFANPSFENNTTNGWSALTNCNIAPAPGVSYQVPNAPHPGTYSLRATSVAAGTMSIQSAPMNINAALLYTASLFVSPQASPPRSVQVSLIGLGTRTQTMSGAVLASTSDAQSTGTLSGAVTSTSSVTGAPVLSVPLSGSASASSAAGVALSNAAAAVSAVSGAPVETVGLNYTGTLATEIANAWERLYAQVDPGYPLPPWVTQIAVRVTWYATAAGEAHYIDDALFEPVWAVRPYFDGQLYNGVPAAANFFWRDPVNLVGPSYYYSNYAHKITRLNAVLTGAPSQAIGHRSPFTLTGFLPAGSVFSLIAPPPV